MVHEITQPNLRPMQDKNGLSLDLGDNIIFNGGQGRIQEYLGDAGKHGARVRVITTTGQTVDIALLLVEAELQSHTSSAEGTKYGV